jgi:hypothetical protein
MSTFEQTMAALQQRHPSTLRRILANLPIAAEDSLDTSATSYARYLERALGEHAYELLTSQLKTPAPALDTAETIAGEVTDALTSIVGLEVEAIANKTADAVAAAYRKQRIMELSKQAGAFFTSFPSSNATPPVPVLLISCLMASFACSSYYTNCTNKGRASHPNLHDVRAHE